MIRTVLAVAGVALGLAAVLQPAPVEATAHSAVRLFSAPSVLPGGRLEVTIVVGGYGRFGQVVETLPAGFSYVGADLSEAAVIVEGQTIRFNLLNEEDVTYTVTTPIAEGSYSFSGVVMDEDRMREVVGGALMLRVGAPATPPPLPTPTATPAPTATPTPAPTATPPPTATRTPAPTATPPPTATRTPAPTATPPPTATRIPAPSATPPPTATPAPAPTAAPEEDDGFSRQVVAAIVVALAIVGGAGYYFRRR